MIEGDQICCLITAQMQFAIRSEVSWWQEVDRCGLGWGAPVTLNRSGAQIRQEGWRDENSGTWVGMQQLIVG